MGVCVCVGGAGCRIKSILLAPNIQLRLKCVLSNLGTVFLKFTTRHFIAIFLAAGLLISFSRFLYDRFKWLLVLLCIECTSLNRF